MNALHLVKSKHLGRSNRHQRGAALIVGLIMLLLLTLIGVAGMRDTLLQEKMVGNMRDREIAVQAAESALRAAEKDLNELNEPVFNNTAGLYDVDFSTPIEVAGETLTARKKLGVRVAEQVFWQQVWNWTDADSKEYPFALDDVVAAPRYVIERLPASMTNKNLYTGGGGAGFVVDITAGADLPEEVSLPDYRITARGQGMSATTAVILQATYRRNK